MALLINYPVLTAPDSSKEFKLVVDASDVGVCAVLLQEGKDKIDLPICYSYFFNKFDKHKNYSTIEKNISSLIVVFETF